MKKSIYNNPINLFLISIIIFQTGSIIRIQLDNQLLGNILRISSTIVLFYSLFRQIIVNKCNNHTKLGGWMKFLLIWNLINIVYSIMSSGLNLTRTLGEDSYLLNYMLPFLLLYNPKSINLKGLFNYSLIFIIFAIILILANYEFLMMANSSYYISTVIEENEDIRTFAQLPIMWSIPAAIIFMNSNFIDKKHTIIALFAYVLAISFSMTFGRRGTSLYGLSFLFIGFWMFLKNPSYKLNKKIIFSSLIIVFTIIAIIFIINNFSFLMDRIDEDSRSGVAEAYYQDMQTNDYIYGRGINGTYYDPSKAFDHINNQRTGIETGYLNIILHSGLLFFIPYLFIGITSAYKGYYKSQNTIVKSLALYILINFLMLYPGSYPAFNLRFFILWIGILFCNSKELRDMTDSQISVYFNLKKI